jgi:hypothetical protein
MDLPLDELVYCTIGAAGLLLEMYPVAYPAIAASITPTMPKQKAVPAPLSQ